MRKKNLLAVSGCLLMGLVLCTTSYAADKVGYINVRRLINESKMGKEAKANLRKMSQEKEALLNTKLQEINRLKEFINKQGDNLSSRERREKIEQLQRRYRDYQRLVADTKEDIAWEDRQLVSIILEKANDILKKVAKKKKFAIILKDPNAIAYLDPKVDITDLVLKELNGKK